MENHYREELQDYLKSISPLSQDSFNTLFSYIEVKSFKKDTCFQNINEKAINIGFLVQGSFVVNREGDSGDIRTVYFNIPTKSPMIGVFESLITKEESRVSITAIEDSIVMSINYKRLLSLYDSDSEINTLGRKLLEKQYLTTLELGRFHQISNLKKRKEIFENDFHYLIGKVKEKDIASYLGTTKSSFSRLKKIGGQFKKTKEIFIKSSKVTN